MRWPTDPVELFIGPDGIALDGHAVVPPPLTVSALPLALKGIRLDAGQRIRVSVDDAWSRSLLLELPTGVAGKDEISLLAAHRLRDIFGAESATWPSCLAARNAYPWHFAAWARRGDPRLVSTLPPAIHEAVVDWSKAAHLRLVGLGSAWGNTLAAVPPGRQGALAVFSGKRMTVGAWSARRWTGWRSFIASDAISAQAELIHWLDGLAWNEGPLLLWYRGWAFNQALAGRWHIQAVPDGRTPGRSPAFDFRASARPRQQWPLRQRIIVAAGLATLLAGVLVSLPDDEAPDASAIVAVRPRPASGSHVPGIEQEPAAPEPQTEALTVTEVTTWPLILGTFEQRGKRWVLYSNEQDSASVRQGGRIDGRFRVDRATVNSVVLTDLRTMERREIPLGNTGVQP